MKRILIVTIKDDAILPPEAKLVLQALLGVNTKIEAKYGFSVTEASPDASHDTIPTDPIPVPPPNPPDVPAPADPQAGAALHDAKIVGGDLRFKLTGTEGWRRQHGGKTIIGIALCNGKKYDFLSESNAKNGIKTIGNLISSDGEYEQALTAGHKYPFSFCDLDRKKFSNEVPVEWK